MRQIAIAMVVPLMIAQAIAAEDTAASKAYQALLHEFEQEGGARIFAKRFLEFAEQHPGDPAATDALLWVVDQVRGKSETTKAIEILTKHHGNSDRLGAACKAIASSRSIAAEKLLRKLTEEHPKKETRAQALYFLAALFELEASLVEQLESQPELAPRVVQYYGKDYGQHLSSLKPAELERRREEVYERMLKFFSDVKIQESKLGEFAEKSLFRLRHLSVGKVAPEIRGEDIDGEEFKLSDFRGKVVMLTFWGHW